MKIKIEQDEAHKAFNDGELFFNKLDGKLISVEAPF